MALLGALALWACLPPRDAPPQGEMECERAFVCAFGSASAKENETSALAEAREDAVAQLGLMAFPTMVRQRWQIARSNDDAVVEGRVEARSVGRLRGVEFSGARAWSERVWTSDGPGLRWNARIMARVSREDIARMRHDALQRTQVLSESLRQRSEEARRALLEYGARQVSRALSVLAQLNRELAGLDEGDVTPAALMALSMLARDLAASMTVQFGGWEFDAHDAKVVVALRAGGEPLRDLPVDVDLGPGSTTAHLITDARGNLRVRSRPLVSAATHGLTVSPLGDTRLSKSITIPVPWSCATAEAQVRVRGWGDVEDRLARAVQQSLSRSLPSATCSGPTSSMLTLRPTVDLFAGEPARLGPRVLHVGARLRFELTAEIDGWILGQSTREAPIKVGAVDLETLRASLVAMVASTLEAMTPGLLSELAESKEQ
jgi:hypothetical protein